MVVCSCPYIKPTWTKQSAADSRIRENAGFVTTPGDTIGKYQPRVPVWRATALASYRFTPALTASLGARYSGSQYSTLDNADTNGFAYMGASRYFTTDLRLRYQVARQWTASFGIDNLNNDKYWNFHPYPQRSYSGNRPSTTLLLDELSPRSLGALIALYEHRVKLFAAADAEPAQLYPAGDGRFEFDRTISRLEEMQSADYLGEGHGLHED